MPRNISFAMTTAQIGARTKTVTRRLGWQFLKPGEELNAVNRTMGFKKGEHPVRLARLRVVSVRREPLNAIRWNDCHYEGFPEMTPAEFVEFFCRGHRCAPDQIVTRIEFEYL
ncbi:MAG: hypothetical protein ACJ741_11135 [Pyrinomonadaceae bacterium]